MAQTALLLIDFQTGFRDPVWGARNNPDAETRALVLLAHAREASWPVHCVRHLSKTAGSPLHPDNGGTDFLPGFAPQEGDTLHEKTVNSGFIGTDLEAALHRQGVTDVVLCGLTTPHCVSTTARMAVNLGFGVTLAHDASAAFTGNADASWSPRLPQPSAEEIHIAAVSHLHGEFVTARSVAEIVGSGR